MANVTMSLEEYEALISRIQGMDPVSMGLELARAGQSFPPTPPAPVKKKRKASAYNRRLGREIKSLTARHKTKAGKWKKGWSQKRMMKAAHKAAKR